MKKGAKKGQLLHLGAVKEPLLREGPNASGCVPCAKRTNSTGLNVERPGENAIVVTQEFIHRAKIAMKPTKLATIVGFLKQRTLLNNIYECCE